MMIDPHKAIATVMDRKRGKDASLEREAPMLPSEVKSKELEMDPRHEAAKDVMGALHGKDSAKLMESLAAFHDLHQMHKESSKASEE